MRLHGVSAADVDAHAAAFALDALGGSVTVQQPQLPNILQTTVIPFVDVQFSFTLLEQANQAGANVRVTPYALRVGGNGQVFQSVKVVPFLAAFAQTTVQQAANITALGLDAARGLISGNAAPAQTLADATKLILNVQASPLPTVFTLRRVSPFFLRAVRCASGSACVRVRADACVRSALLVCVRSMDIFIRAQIQVNGGDIATVL
jgi:hypothetical protein